MGWTEQDLFKLRQAAGSYPYSGVIFDAAGNLYGTTAFSGSNGGGTAFELSPSNGGWSFSVLFNFVGNNGGPRANLVFDQAGNLYGTTLADGSFQLGSVFKLTPGGGGWSYVSLHDFNDPLVAAYPMSNVVFDTSGNLYGTTSEGYHTAFCSGGCGVVWEITP